MAKYTYEEQFNAISTAICQFEDLMESADDEYIENIQPTIDILRYMLEKLRKKRDKPSKAQIKWAHQVAEKIRNQQTNKEVTDETIHN